eukprot:COSAG05_NODE_1102_length_5875_cov_3.746364_4_plen_391_part_00
MRHSHRHTIESDGSVCAVWNDDDDDDDDDDDACSDWPDGHHCHPPGYPPSKLCCLAPGQKRGCNGIPPCRNQTVDPQTICHDSGFASVMVYGSALRWLPRLRGLSAMRMQQDTPAVNATGFDLDMTLAMLRATHTNTYEFDVCDPPARPPDRGSPPPPPDFRPRRGFGQLVAFLRATAGLVVDGEQLRVWVLLVPPSEALLNSTMCQPPADNPYTHANETAVFGNATYSSPAGYLAWSSLIGQLALQFPHIVAVGIDDFIENIPSTFSPQLLAQMTSMMRRLAPWLSFVPVTYYGQFESWPGLPAAIDAPIFFFQNLKQGAGPCAQQGCVWGPKHPANFSGCPSSKGSCGCLAGKCADSTVLNFPDELADIAAAMPVRTFLCACLTVHCF